MILLRSITLNFPTPPAVTTCTALSAATKSLSGASEVPPGLLARNTISSSLNVVGFSTTLTPLESSHSVMPTASFVAVLTTLPATGAESTRVAFATVST